MTTPRPKYVAKRVLQSALGFHGYLVAHALFAAGTLRFRHENGEVLAFVARLSEDAVVLDVGANVGSTALTFAKRCPRGKVYAFEPIPENARAARAVLALCGVRNAELFEVAVGDQDGTLEMVMPVEGSLRLEGLSHVARDGSDEAGAHYSVPSVRLDDFAPLRGVRVDAIKIDVEDHEQFVLRGAEEIIARDRPLIYCEIWSEANMDGCRDVLEKHGYAMKVLRGGELVAYDPAWGLDDLNYFFVP
jgi:FkbM family methyltransferase